MRRELPTLVLVSVDAMVLGLVGAFHAWVRPRLVAVYAEIAGPPPLAQAALSGWLLPAAAAAMVVLTLLAFAQAKRGARLRLLAIAVGLGASAFLGCALAAYLPLLL